MQQLSAPIWTAGLVNAKQARSAWVEKLSALDRLQLSNVEALDWGFGLKLNGSGRFWAWWSRAPILEHLFLLQARELDDYGTHLVLSEEKTGESPHVRAAICSWNELPRAAEYLRCLPLKGPCVGNTTSALSVASQQIPATLQITEAPLNGVQIPSYCPTKFGTLLRLDQQKAREVSSYLCVDQPNDCSGPLLVNLGAGVFAVFAWSGSAGEPLRTHLCGKWATDLALRDAERWLKSQGSRNRNNPTHLTP